MRLPPFTALRALEAAARLKSYSRAADDLAVTHGAVSQQIRRLEDEMGAELFVRRGNAMEPTPAAERLAETVRRAIRTLETGYAEAVESLRRGPLVLSSEAEFARVWLLPRLTRVRDELGEAQLEIRVEDRLAGFGADGVDAGVRYGRGPWPGLEHRELFRDRLVVVCSPEFAETHGIDGPEAVARAPVLEHSVWPWSLWSAVSGIAVPRSQLGLTLDNSSMLLHAAGQGLGVGLARLSLAAHEIRAGRLVSPCGPAVPIPESYWAVWRGGGPKAARIGGLVAWLVEETREVERVSPEPAVS